MQVIIHPEPSPHPSVVSKKNDVSSSHSNSEELKLSRMDILKSFRNTTEMMLLKEWVPVPDSYEWTEEEKRMFAFIDSLKQNFTEDNLRNATFLPRSYWQYDKEKKYLDTTMYGSQKLGNDKLNQYCAFVQSRRYCDVLNHDKNWHSLHLDDGSTPGQALNQFLSVFPQNNDTFVVFVGDSTSSDFFYALACASMRAESMGYLTVNAKTCNLSLNGFAEQICVEFDSRRILFAVKEKWHADKADFEVIVKEANRKIDLLMLNFGTHYHRKQLDKMQNDTDAVLEYLVSDEALQKVAAVIVRGTIPQSFDVDGGQYDVMSAERQEEAKNMAQNRHCQNNANYYDELVGGVWREHVWMRATEKISSLRLIPYISMSYLNSLPYVHPDSRCERTWPAEIWSQDTPCFFALDCTHVCLSNFVYEPLLRRIADAINLITSQIA